MRTSRHERGLREFFGCALRRDRRSPWPGCRSGSWSKSTPWRLLDPQKIMIASSGDGVGSGEPRGLQILPSGAKPSEVGSIPTHSRHRAVHGGLGCGPWPSFCRAGMGGSRWCAVRRKSSSPRLALGRCSARPAPGEPRRTERHLPLGGSSRTRAVKAAALSHWRRTCHRHQSSNAKGESKRRLADAAPREASELLYDGLAGRSLSIGGAT